MTLLAGPEPGATEVRVWTLEQRSPADVVPARPPRVPADLVEVETAVPELNRFLYTAVGGDWYWVDRLPWTYAQWQAWVDRPEHRTLLAQVGGAPAGYAELDGQPQGAVEVAYFGLLPQFTGLGLGGWLLEQALREAWATPGAARVWVHTCSLDGPAALANYRARGLTVVDETVEYRDLNSSTPGPWPGADRRRPDPAPPA